MRIRSSAMDRQRKIVVPPSRAGTAPMRLPPWKSISVRLMAKPSPNERHPALHACAIRPHLACESNFHKIAFSIIYIIPLILANRMRRLMTTAFVKRESGKSANMTVLLISVAAFTNIAIGFAISYIVVGDAMLARQPVVRGAAMPDGQPGDQDAAGASGPSQPDPQARCTTARAVIPGFRDAIPKMKTALSQELSDPYRPLKEKHLLALAKMSQELLGMPDDPVKNSAAFTFQLDQLKAQFESSVSNLSVVNKTSIAKTTCEALLGEVEKIDAMLNSLDL